MKVLRSTVNMAETVPSQQGVPHLKTRMLTGSGVSALTELKTIQTTDSTGKIVYVNVDRSLASSSYDGKSISQTCATSSQQTATTTSYDIHTITPESFTTPNTCNISLDGNSTITNSNVMLSSAAVLSHGESFQSIPLLTQSPRKADSAGNLSASEISVFDNSAFLGGLNHEELKSVDSFLDSLVIETSTPLVENRGEPKQMQYQIQQYPVQDLTSSTPLKPPSSQPTSENPPAGNNELRPNILSNKFTAVSDIYLQSADKGIDSSYNLVPSAKYVMPKNMASAVKKHVSSFTPDFSLYPGHCACPPDLEVIHVPVEQIYVTPNQLRYMSQIGVIVISMEEYVGFLRGDKWYVSVGEIVERLIPEQKKNVENYLLETSVGCEKEFLVSWEINYLKQRKCISHSTSMMGISLSLDSLREMCRSLLNKHVFVKSSTTSLQNAANGPYFRKELGKRTRCSLCGAPTRVLDLNDEYVLLDAPMDSTVVEIDAASNGMIGSGLVSNTVSPGSLTPDLQPELTNNERDIEIKHVIVGSFVFHAFRINSLTYLSLKELVLLKVLTIQALQTGLLKQQYQPRRAPSIVDSYYRSQDIQVDDTLWIDIITIRCVCCMGKQSSGCSFDLYGRFARGHWSEDFVLLIKGVDDRENEQKVFTLDPYTYKINLKYSETKKNNKSKKRTTKDTKSSKCRKEEMSSSTKEYSVNAAKPHHKDDNSHNSISSTSDIIRQKKDHKTMLKPGIYYFKNKESVLEFLDSGGNMADSSKKKKDNEKVHVVNVQNKSKPEATKKDVKTETIQTGRAKVATSHSLDVQFRVKPAQPPHKMLIESRALKYMPKERHRSADSSKESTGSADSSHSPSEITVTSSQKVLGNVKNKELSSENHVAKEQEKPQNSCDLDKSSVSDNSFVIVQGDALHEETELAAMSIGNSKIMTNCGEDCEENIVTSTQITDSDNDKVVVIQNSTVPDFTPLSSLDIDYKEQAVVDTTILDPFCDNDNSNMSESNIVTPHNDTTQIDTKAVGLSQVTGDTISSESRCTLDSQETKSSSPKPQKICEQLTLDVAKNKDLQEMTNDCCDVISSNGSHSDTNYLHKEQQHREKIQDCVIRLEDICKSPTRGINLFRAEESSTMNENSNSLKKSDQNLNLLTETGFEPDSLLSDKQVKTSSRIEPSTSNIDSLTETKSNQISQEVKNTDNDSSSLVKMSASKIHCSHSPAKVSIPESETDTLSGNQNVLKSPKSSNSTSISSSVKGNNDDQIEKISEIIEVEKEKKVVDIEIDGNADSKHNEAKFDSPIVKPSIGLFSSPTSLLGFDSSQFSSPSKPLYKERTMKKVFDKVAMMGDTCNADKSLEVLATVAECFKDDSDASQSEEEQVDEKNVDIELQIDNKKQTDKTVTEMEHIHKEEIKLVLKNVAKYMDIMYKPETEGLRLCMKFKKGAETVFPGIFEPGSEDRKKKFIGVLSRFLTSRYYAVTEKPKQNSIVTSLKRKRKLPRLMASVRQSKRKRLK